MSSASKTFRLPRANKTSPSSPARKTSSVNTNEFSWFSGLKLRISQLSMPDWFGQLSIGGSAVTNSQQMESSEFDELGLIATPKSDEVNMSSQNNSVESTHNADHHYDTINKFFDQSSIFLNEESDPDEWQSWTLNAALWGAEGDYRDTLVKQHFGPLRNLVTLCQQPGKGHSFISLSIVQPTWCDKCGDFMWGFLSTAVKCENCSYTCHSKCKALVTLDCRSANSSVKSDRTWPSPPLIYPDLKQHRNSMPSAPSVENPIEKFDVKVEKNTGESDFVQIHMNFTRPINVVAGETPPTFLDVVGNSGDATASSFRTITTFFLPRNTVKTVNISDDITVRQMIVTLLQKFKVADNPRKFALYERQIITDPDGAEIENKMVRLSDNDFPLRIYRQWQIDSLQRQFVLQENDTGDILWEMFEIPELENFLTILQNEERQYIFKIRQKYDVYRYYLSEQLRIRGACVESEANTLLYSPFPQVLQEDDLFDSMRSDSIFGTPRTDKSDDSRRSISNVDSVKRKDCESVFI